MVLFYSYGMPVLGFARTATGIAHKDAGVGQIGPGIVRIPMTCFTEGMKKILTEAFF